MTTREIKKECYQTTIEWSRASMYEQIKSDQRKKDTKISIFAKLINLF